MLRIEGQQEVRVNFELRELIVTGFVAAALVLKLAIAREERHLEALFGPAWLAYRGRVRRWIGRH